MKAVHLQKDDRVFFPTGQVGKVITSLIDGNTIIVQFDCFETTYSSIDELLVGRNGQVL